MSGEAELALADGPVGPLPVVDDVPEVTVRGPCTRRKGAWLVSLFLVNGQRPRDRSKDEAWLFQPWLAVESGDGSAVFVGRQEAVPDQSLAEDDEKRELVRRPVREPGNVAAAGPHDGHRAAADGAWPTGAGRRA